MIDDENIYRMIGGLGFPIVVALYHMIYQERTLRNLTTAINRLTDYIFGNLTGNLKAEHNLKVKGG